MRNYTWLENLLFFSPACDISRMISAVNNKTIVITGASSGIGKETARLLRNTTAHIVLVARREEQLKRAKEEIEKGTASVSIYKADLRNELELIGFLAFLHQLPNGVDIFINNAGLSINRPIMKSLDRYHDFTRTMAINYFAPVQLVLSLVPLLEKNNGHIVNISTINALLMPIPYWAAYQSSKGAFDMWLRSAQPELFAGGIAATTVYLPLVRTPMILPTAAYANAPAMSPVHAAHWIGRALYTRKRSLKPWWLVFGQLGSVVFRTPLEWAVSQRVILKEQKKHA